MTDTFKSIEQGLKEAIANGATTHHVIIDLVQATEYIKELEDKLAVAEAKLLGLTYRVRGESVEKNREK
jgi:hypothetical protein